MTQLKGVITALITPFDLQGNLDEEGLRRLIRFQIQGGVDGIVPLGTTGEAPTLSEEEKNRIIKISKEEINDNTLFVVGTGGYATSQVIRDTNIAADLGADIALIIAPYYNKPTQKGLFLHYEAIARQSKIPLIIYNHPGRTGVNIQIDTLQRLAELPNIIGLKDASGNISQISETIETISAFRPEFSIMSADDAMTLPLMALGGHGVISVVSNLLPKGMKALTNAAEQGNFELARQLHYNLMPLFKASFIETNPIPIKAALKLCGFPAGECRLPLCSLSPEHARILESAVRRYSDIRQIANTATK